MPAPIGLAATWDPTAAKQYGDLLGHEAWATGHNVVLGPELDIARIPVFGLFPTSRASRAISSWRPPSTTR
ncbi:MAG: hypothetical protein E6J33_01695 [Chloroflexi bacterium]|nr:MAG: hypothetical protein E6J33_01695 [Chloroflexota bacterium]